MITGLDYVFISNLSAHIAEKNFLAKLHLIWNTPIIEEYERRPDHLEIFFAKNELMNKAHEENGFSLDPNGEACFMLLARKIKFLQGEVHIRGWKYPKEMINIEPYNSQLSLKNIWEYTLVLPSPITANAFSRQLYNALLYSLS